MRLIHVAEDVSRASGGVRTVIKDLNNQFNKSRIISAVKDPDDPYKEFKSTIWNYSKGLHEYLKNNAHEARFHIHGVWMHSQFTAARIANNNNNPFILTPHGMYEPWLWKSGAIKKKWYFNTLVKSAFAKAKYIHAITPQEASNLAQLFPATSIRCIPNAIAIMEPPRRKQSDRPYLLFLGRIHPKKGVKMLIETFHSMPELDIDLKIAGPLDDYGKQLNLWTNDLHDSRIKFLGAVQGDEKNKLYACARAFVAPSYSEVVGMVNLEAAMMATPVITTHQTGLMKEWHQEGGILIDPTQEALREAIVSAASWDEQEVEQRGSRLRKFVIDNYSWDVVKPQWVELYKDIGIDEF